MAKGITPKYERPAKFTEVAARVHAELTKGGYAKGYGPKTYRVMNNVHHPLFNCGAEDLRFLKEKGHIALVGLVYVLGQEPLPKELLPTYNKYK